MKFVINLLFVLVMFNMLVFAIYVNNTNRRITILEAQVEVLKAR